MAHAVVHTRRDALSHRMVDMMVHPRHTAPLLRSDACTERLVAGSNKAFHRHVAHGEHADFTFEGMARWFAPGILVLANAAAGRQMRVAHVAHADAADALIARCAGAPDQSPYPIAHEVDVQPVVSLFSMEPEAYQVAEGDATAALRSRSTMFRSVTVFDRVPAHYTHWGAFAIDRAAAEEIAAGASDRVPVHRTCAQVGGGVRAMPVCMDTNTADLLQTGDLFVVSAARDACTGVPEAVDALVYVPTIEKYLEGSARIVEWTEQCVLPVIQYAALSHAECIIACDGGLRPLIPGGGGGGGGGAGGGGDSGAVDDDGGGSA